MSYGVKYRCTHKTFTNQTETTYRIDILKDGYSGSITEVLGMGDVFSLEYERIDPTRPLNTPLQNSRLEFNIAIQNDTELAILEEIFENDERTFKMQLYQDGTLFWDGYVLNDLLEYGQGNYPFQGRIVAKDITALKSFTYPLEDERRTAIHQFGVLLDPLDIGTGLKTATSWSHSEMSATNTFLAQSYIDTIAFREFRPLTEEGANDDRQITYYEALEQLARSFGVIVRQSFGEWHIVQLSELRGSTSRICTFDFAGSQLTNAVQSITDSVDRETTYILPQSQNTFNPGLKEAQFTFNHRSLENDIVFPATVALADGENNETPRSFSQNISSTSVEGNPVTGRGGITPFIRFRANAEVTYQKILDGTTQQNDARIADVTISRNTFAMVEIKIETVAKTYYLNNNFDWVTDESRIVLRGFDSDKPTIVRTTSGGRNAGVGYALRDWKIDFDIQSEPLPTDADGTLSVNLYLSRMDAPTEFGVLSITNDQQEQFYAGSDVYASSTRFKNIEFDVDKPAELANTESISFNIVNSGTNLSATYDHGSVIFGDGPESFSPSAIRYGTGEADFTTGDWTLAGESGGTYANTLLKEILFTQASARRNLTAELYGNYKPHRILGFEDYRFFFLGGDLNGSNVWSADFLEIKYESSTPTFDTKTEGGGSSFSGASSGDLETFRESVKANQFFNTIFLSNFIGELSSAIEAGSTITSFRADLSAQIRVGEDFVLVDKENERPFFVNVVADPVSGAEEYNTGENVEVHVEEQYISNELPVGSPVILAGGLLESYFSVDPNKLLISVQTRDESFYYGKVNEDFSGGATKTSLSLVNSDITATNQAVFNDGQVLRLRREDGESQLVTVNGDQSFSSSPYTLQLDSFTTDFLAFGVSTPQFAKYKAYIEPVNQGSSIEFLKGQLILSADGSGGLAQIRLDGTGASSSITLDADNINVVGQTTFTSGLVSEGLETQSGAQSKANTAQSNAEATASTLATQAKNDARDNVATNLGYTDYNDMVSEAQAGNTVISGGSIRTSLIDTTSLFAQTIVIDTGGSIQSSVYGAGSSGFKINADGSAEFNNVSVRSSNFSSTSSGFEVTGSGIQFNENITIGGTASNNTLKMVNPTIASESTTAGGSGDNLAYYHRPQSGTAATFVRSNQYFLSHSDHETLDGSNNEVGSSLFFGFYTGGASPTTFMSANGDGSFTFKVDGDIEYTGSISQTSDAELKENVVPLGQTLDKITQLEAKVYDMVDDDEREIGLFAQDVEPLFPEAVNTVTRPNEEGEEITYKTLSYIQLIPALIESIKELKQEIDQLKNG